MQSILQNRKFIVNENGNKVAVLLDIIAYKKLEDFYEDFVLGKKMKKAKKSRSYTLKAAAKRLKYEL